MRGISTPIPFICAPCVEHTAIVVLYEKVVCVCGARSIITIVTFNPSVNKTICK